MHWNILSALAVVAFVSFAPVTNAQQAQQGQASQPQAADPDAINAPEQLRGRSIVIDYVETRTARPAGGGRADTRRVPFQLVVYISTENRAFNRFAPNHGRAGSSDQVKGTKDITNYAARNVVFDGPKMTVTNNFGRAAGAKVGGSGKREITATFDENFKNCTANVVVTVEGEFARRRLMKGGFEDLLSAKNDSFECRVQDGNALVGNS